MPNDNFKSKTVWKYGFDVRDGVQAASIPNGYRVLAVAAQGDMVCMWAEVTPENLPVKQYFKVIGTGHPIELIANYAGTAFIGQYVWHLYQFGGRPNAR